jgi:two-component system, chemotaxis family, chemotaxis protein CheY
MSFAPLLRSKDQQPFRFLIVDDSAFARRNLARIVESFGGKIVAEAADGSAAVQQYAQHHPDVVLMDVTMPQMRGIEAVELIMKKDVKACIIMVSSVGSQDNVVLALQKGARHFVQKPVKPEVLYEVLRYVLGESLAKSQKAAAGVQP